MLEHLSIAVCRAGGLATIGIHFDAQSGMLTGTRLVIPDDPRFNFPVVDCCLTTHAESLTSLLSQAELDACTLDQRWEIKELATEFAANLAARLVTLGAGGSPSPLAIGVHGFDAWRIRNTVRCFESYVCPATLAERTGLSVVDDFPAKDLAHSGLGGPIETLGLWLLLSDRSSIPGRRWRGLVRLGRTLNVTVIPPIQDIPDQKNSVSLDLGVGCSLASAICEAQGLPPMSAEDMSSAIDQGATPDWAVLDAWRAAIGDLGWHPHGASPTGLVSLLGQADRPETADLLLTANLLLCERIDAFLRDMSARTHPLGELVLAGEGLRNERLVREVHRQVKGISVVTLDELGYEGNLPAMSVAALTALHCLGFPTPPTVAGTPPRVLGRISPGSPSNWQRVLQVMAAGGPTLRPLSEAI